MLDRGNRLSGYEDSGGSYRKRLAFRSAVCCSVGCNEQRGFASSDIYYPSESRSRTRVLTIADDVGLQRSSRVVGVTPWAGHEGLDSPRGSIIASRSLLWRSGGSELMAMSIHLHAPIWISEGPEEPSGYRYYLSVISFNGIDIPDHTSGGGDPIQAVEIAISAIDWVLKRNSKKYAFFFESGEPYFED